MPKGQYSREALEADMFDDVFPKSDVDNKKMHNVMYYIYNSSNGVAYTDLVEKILIVQLELTITSWLRITMMEIPF